jgi:hypothetical protein
MPTKAFSAHQVAERRIGFVQFATDAQKTLSDSAVAHQGGLFSADRTWRVADSVRLFFTHGFFPFF